MEDERLGLPSASGMDRTVYCTGSHLLNQYTKEQGDDRPKKRGTKIHAIMEGLLPIERATHSERICVERMSFEEGRLVDKLGFEGSEQIKEDRMWSFDDDKNKVFSGKPDVIHLSALRALVVNYKTGFYPPTPIKDNLQMMTEGVLAAIKYPLSLVTVALVHPNAPNDDGSISQHATYAANFLRNEIRPLFNQRSKEAMQVDAPRTPGKHCEWCAGKKLGICKEYQEYKQKGNQ